MTEIVGQIAVGRSGSRGLVVAESKGILTLDCGGVMQQVARNAVIRFESQAPTTPTEPDPIKVGDRFYLKSWFPGHGAEWWTVMEPKNQHGNYLLRSDSGNWAGLDAAKIRRDVIEQEVKL